MPDEKESPNLTFSGTFDKSDSSTMQKLLEWSIKSGKKLIIVTEALVLIALFSKFSLIRNVNAINYRIEDLKFEVIENQDIERHYNLILSDINKIKEVENSRIDWDLRITSISDKIPDDMRLIKVGYSPDSSEISATVGSIQGFAFFIQQLLNDDQTDRIILKSSKYSKTNQQYEFTLSVIIK